MEHSRGRGGRSAPPQSVSREELVRRLAAAREELRVADAEVRSQHEQIVGLLRLQAGQRDELDRLVAGARGEDVRPLSAGLARLAALPIDTSTSGELLRAAAAVCGEVLGAGTKVTIQLGAPERPEVVSSTGRLAQELDGAQLASGEGPTVDSFAEAAVVTTTDLGRDRRWPALAGVPGADAVAVVAAPLEGEDGARGVLTAYRPRTGPGTGTGADDALRDAVGLLALAVRQLLQERDLHEEIRRAGEDLDRALVSRAVIDQAKGIVMAHKGGTAEEAFQHLVDLASSRHVKVRDLAQAVVDQAGDRVGDRQE